MIALLVIVSIVLALVWSRRPLRAALQRGVLDQIIQQAPSVVLLLRNGRIVRTNGELTRILGYTAEEVHGRPLSDFIDRATDAMRRSEVETTAHAKDGSTRIVLMIRLPVTMADGDVDVLVVLRDITENKRADEALHDLPRRLIAAQEAEGQRIARELHDEIGQVLTGVGMMLGANHVSPDVAPRLQEAQAMLLDLAARVRNLALDLRPALLDDFGLLPAIEALLQRYTRQTGVEVQLDHDGVANTRFPPEVEITAYRIVQEALTNVAKYAGVREAAVTMLADDDALTVTIEDRGAGFDPQRVARSAAGLSGMRERAGILGGRLTIGSSRGAGTRITAVLPVGGGEVDAE
jgi:PAS domain S-box-containing protein